MPTISPPRTASETPRSAGSAAIALGMQVVRLEHDVPALGSLRSAAASGLDLAPDHQRRQALGRRARGRDVATTRPPRSTVMRSETSEHLVQLVRDEDDRAAVGRHRAQRLEQRARLLRGQHRGRLVEDQHARVAVERLEDLDALLLADRELPDARARIDGQAELLAELGDTRSSAARSGTSRRVALVAERDVLGDRERLDEAEVLVHHPHAARERVARRAQLHGLAVQLERPLVRAVEARDDVRERALARAVLAEQRVHLAGVDLEIDAGVRDDAGEALRDAPQRHRGSRSGDAAGVVHARTISPWESRRRP